MIIDAHQHFWRYTPDEFGWIASDALRCDFGPSDLSREIFAAGVDRVIAVEARQTVAETEQLLKFAEEHDFIAGVTGWLPIAAPDFAASLERFADEPKLKALRHVVQDEPDDAFILGDDFNRGVDEVGKRGLAYEILVFQRQLPNAIRFADRHPSLRLVLDHMGKPKSGEEAAWRWLVKDLARRDNVWCKVSGLVTEFGKADFRPYVETVLEAFGPERVMWGSDWPVVTADLSYAEWFATCKSLLPVPCLGSTAAQFYGLNLLNTCTS